MVSGGGGGGDTVGEAVSHKMAQLPQLETAGWR